MAIDRPYDGNTFVGFVDISGFRELMRRGDQAVKALDRFYNAGYEALRVQPGSSMQVEGVFVSDCGVLFVRNHGADFGALQALLSRIEEINRTVLADDIMLSTSVAFGAFKYENRLEFTGISKNPIYGNAYVSAFLDNESGKPRIRPGQCRILPHGLPSDLWTSPGTYSARIKQSETEHRYFYWMLSSPDEIDRFERECKIARTLEYTALLKALRRASHVDHGDS